MSYPTIFYFPHEPIGSCFNWTHYNEVHVPLALEVYRNSSFQHMDIIELGPSDPYQLVAISYFEEQDFLDLDLQVLWNDVPNYTKSTPFLTPGKLNSSFSALE